MLRPVGEDDSVPPDVEELARTVRAGARAPTVGVERARRARRPALRVDELDEDDDFLDFDLGEEGPPRGLSGHNEAPKLDHWTVKAHVYTKEVAANVSLLAGLFGIKGTHVSAGVVHEAKRYRRERTPENTQVEVGVAVRLIAATTRWDVQADISIPNIAAAVNLNAEVGDARIGIEVSGYSGPLGDLLPAPNNLDVSTLVDYLGAFHKVQRLVFGTGGLAFLTPTVINWEDDGAR